MGFTSDKISKALNLALASLLRTRSPPDVLRRRRHRLSVLAPGTAEGGASLRLLERRWKRRYGRAARDWAEPFVEGHEPGGGTGRPGHRHGPCRRHDSHRTGRTSRESVCVCACEGETGSELGKGVAFRGRGGTALPAEGKDAQVASSNLTPPLVTACSQALYRPWSLGTAWRPASCLWFLGVVL